MESQRNGTSKGTSCQEIIFQEEIVDFEVQDSSTRLFDDISHEILKMQQELSMRYPSSEAWGTKGPMNEDSLDHDILEFGKHYRMWEKQQHTSFIKYYSEACGKKGPMDEDGPDLNIFKKEKLKPVHQFNVSTEKWKHVKNFDDEIWRKHEEWFTKTNFQSCEDLVFPKKEKFKSVQQFDSFAAISVLGSRWPLGFNEIFNKQQESSREFPPSQARRNRVRMLDKSRKVESLAHKFKPLATYSLPGSRRFMSKKPQKSSTLLKHELTGEKWQKSWSFPIIMSNRKFLSLVEAAAPSTTAIAKNLIPKLVPTDKSSSTCWFLSVPFIAMLCMLIPTPKTTTAWVFTIAASVLVGFFFGVMDARRRLKAVAATPPPVTEGNIAGATSKTAVYIKIATTGNHVITTGITAAAGPSRNINILLNLSRGM